MLTATRTAFLLLSAGWKHFFAVICLIALLSLTAGLLGVYALRFDSGAEPLGVAVVNLDGSLESRLLISALPDGGADDELLQIHHVSEAQADIMLADGSVSAVFTLPEGFMRAVISGENNPIQAVYNPATPVRSNLLRVMADSLLGLLRTSQTGVYTALNYTAENSPMHYTDVFGRVNMRYLGIAAANTAAFRRIEITATGEVPPLAHYLSSALIFFYTLSLMILIPLVRSGFPDEILRRIRLMGRGSISTAAPWILSLWIWLMLSTLPLLGAYLLAARIFPVTALASSILPPVIISLTVICFYLAALAAFLSFLPVSPIVCGWVLCVFAAASLWFSGGVLPLSFLPEGYRAIAGYLPAYHAGRLLGGTLHGELFRGAVRDLLIAGGVLSVCCAAAVRHRSRIRR
ncbi:MAG: ABC transporter permease [Oscillospiraceae bacterium]|nr:ABC transporter permease [Oscillospiraceae bacterium]